MTTITQEKYLDHPYNDLILSSIEEAKNNSFSISDFTLSIPGMSGQTYRKFINNLNKKIENPRYFEIGYWKGSTLCSAVDGVENIKVVALDDFSHGEVQHYGKAILEEVKSNVEKVKTQNSNISILQGDFNSFEYEKFGPFNVYFFDGPHTEEDHVNALKYAVNSMDDTFIYIVDDWNNHGSVSHIKTGTYRGIEETNLEILFKVEIETGHNPSVGSQNDWHNGCGIFVLRKK